MQGKHAGLLLVAAWCLVSAAANVYVASLLRNLPPSLLCFGVFAIVLAVFVFSKLASIRSWISMLKLNFGRVMFINVTTFVIWYSTIYPLKYLEPAVVTAIILTTMPLFTVLINVARKNRAGHMKYDTIISFLLFAGIFLLAALVFSRKTAVTTPIVTHTFISFLLAILAGFSLAVNNIVVKQLVRQGCTPTDILSSRFFLLVLLSGVMSLSSAHVIINAGLVLDICIAALLLVIVPQLLLQFALQKLEAISVSIVSSFKPVIVFCFEAFDQDLRLTVWTLLALIYLAVVSISGIMYRYRCLVR